MTKRISQITVLSLFVAALVTLPVLSRAEGAGTNAPGSSGQTAPAKPKKHDGLVFRGTVSAIDAKAMTLTVETRTFVVTPQTKILKDGQPATLDSGVVGEPVSGAYNKTDDGKLVAASVHFKSEKKK